MRARRGPRPERDPDAERRKIEERTVERWVDEGSVRDQAEAATRRATSDGARRRRRAPVELDDRVGEQVIHAVGARRGARLKPRLADAAGALDAERFDDALRQARSLLVELDGVAAVHRIAGLAAYRLGRWKEAAARLEAAEQLEHSAEHLPVLADASRALQRWHRVDELWAALRDESPAQEIMAEGRIVAASAAADRGDLRAALTLMEPTARMRGKVRDHHLRLWYVLADLHDRAGDPIAAARHFERIAEHDPEFVDVRQRLDALGR